MNPTNWQHGVYAAVILVVISLLTLGNVTAGAAAAISFFVSREHAQRENQIARERNNDVRDLQWWQGFTGWDRDRALDAGVPIVVCAALWLAAGWIT